MLALCAAGAAFAQSQTQPEPEDVVEPCTLEPGPLRTVTGVIDAETLKLDDGSEVRLIGALGPRASDAEAKPGDWPLETTAIKALSDLVLGRPIKLAYGGPRADRYGRHLAHVFLQSGGQPEWVQGSLLSAGYARAYGLPGSFICARELLAHEREARTHQRGVWGNAVYQPKDASRTGYLMSLRNRFERVEGTIASVSRTKSAVFLNFGRDWKSDFTARIGKTVLAAHPEWDKGLSEWTGRRVAVRGWIERRNGPMIDIADPSQIEDGGSDGEYLSRAPSGTETITEPAGATEGEVPKQDRPAPPIGKAPGAVDL